MPVTSLWLVQVALCESNATFWAVLAASYFPPAIAHSISCPPLQAQEEGLVVQWQGMEACVHRAHLPGPWDRPEDVAVGETLACTLLYVQPLVQRPYLSAQGSLGRAPFGAIRPGVLLDAQVVAVEHGAVHLRLEPGGIRALCPRPLVADQDVEDARDFVNAGEQLRSVFAHMLFSLSPYWLQQDFLFRCFTSVAPCQQCC